jgi:Kef-type K+ transport system membrane component KefB
MFADIGIMFIMFLAGLELDGEEVKLHKSNAICFGLLVFTIPGTIAFLIFNVLLDYSVLTSLLVSLMFATQTLVSHNIASRLGLSSNRAVVTAVGGTVITDALVLFSLGLIISSDTLDGYYILIFLAKVAGFMLVIFGAFPVIIKRILHNFHSKEFAENVYFSIVMAMLFIAGMLAHRIGLEGIIGAFMAGIVFNHYVPKDSQLMRKIQFAGNAIFVPMFMLYVGMLINYQSVLENTNTLILAGILSMASISSKLFVSWLTGTIFKFAKDETGLLFGLTSSQAAVVVAIALIGYNTGLIPISLLNAAVILILASCIISPIVTMHYSRRIAEKQIRQQ